MRTEYTSVEGSETETHPTTEHAAKHIVFGVSAKLRFNVDFVGWRFVLLGHLFAVGEELCVFRTFATQALSFCDVTFHLGQLIAENATFRIQGLGWPRYD